MKIIAVGWNYLDHNKEMNRTLLPKEPVIFLKPETALLKDHKPFFLPDFSNKIEYETEIVVHICRLGKNIAPRFAHRYYDAVTSASILRHGDYNPGCEVKELRGKYPRVLILRQLSEILSRLIRLEKYKILPFHCKLTEKRYSREIQ